MNIYCCCLQILVNKLKNIQNGPKSMYVNKYGSKDYMGYADSEYDIFINVICIFLLFTSYGKISKMVTLTYFQRLDGVIKC